MSEQPAWQYAFNNGPGSLFTGYAWSLDTFTDFVWQDLTRLSAIVVVLLILEAVVVQMGCMVYEFILLQKCNVSHMRLFSVFLGLPSATVRFMVRRPLVVDDSTNDDMDDDELDLIEGAAAVAGGPPAPAGEGGVNCVAGEAAAANKKSVRLAEDEDGKGKPEVTAREQAGRGSKLKTKTTTQKTKVPVGRIAAFQKKVYKQLFGWMDPKFKRNGKKMAPSSRVVWHFMGPLLLWVAAVVVIYGASYNNLQGLQGPLASLDTSAHVMYRLTRARLMANLLAFSVQDADNAKYRASLKQELGLLQQEYRVLLYGGSMLLQANVSFKAEAPAAVFQDAALADIFFKTTACLRDDQSTCFQPGDEMYMITHSGLDAQIHRYLDEMEAFSNVPDALALANHSSYEFTSKVTSRDTYEGLQKAANIFVEGTLAKLDAVKQLHIILLVISLCGMALFVLLLYRPLIKALRRDVKAVVNMLSQLPAEVDIEGLVKTCVLGIVKTDAGSRSMELLAGGPPNTQLQATGFGAPGIGIMAAGGGGGWGMNAGSGMQGGGSGGDGWFGRRSSNNAHQPNDPRMHGYGMHNGLGMQYGSMV